MATGKYLTVALLAVVALVLVFPARAHAYLDPGTGSYLWQIALAALAGSLFAIRLFWTRIKLFFKNLRSKPKKEAPDEG